MKNIINILLLLCISGCSSKDMAPIEYHTNEYFGDHNTLNKSHYDNQTKETLEEDEIIVHKFGYEDKTYEPGKKHTLKEEIKKPETFPSNTKRGLNQELIINDNDNESPNLNLKSLRDTKEEKKVVLIETNKFISPVEGKLSVKFGQQFMNDMCKGIIISAAPQEVVKAVESGEVALCVYDPKYGNMVMIKHKDNFSTVYGHLDDLILEKGDKISKGQVIGHVGSTGNTKANVLFFGVKENGRAVNPEKYLPKLF